MFEYAAYLRQTGNNVKILVREKHGELRNFFEADVVPDYSPANIPECDIIVATKPREVVDAWNSRRGRVVHFCQGFEIINLNHKISGKFLPIDFKKSGLLNRFNFIRKKQSWKRKIVQIDKAYRLPAHLITVSEHLKQELEKRYGRPVHLCRNGVHKEFFFPARNWGAKEYSQEYPMRIISIGSGDEPLKGISTTFDAVRILKSEGYPIKFIRVTSSPIQKKKESGIIDELYENLSQARLGDLLRSCHVYISNSTEGEGFGLPAMEAMSCGLACILSSISSYRGFSKRRDFCVFVMEGDADATAETVKELLAMPEKLLVMRKAALEVAESYSHDKACAKFAELLEIIIDYSRDG